MLELLSDINLCSRFDISDSSLASGVTQGSFVGWGGAVAVGGVGYAIWTENRGSEWSPDKGGTDQVTLLYGNYRAKSSNCLDADYAAGEPLYVGTGGILTNVDPGSGIVVAYAIGDEEDYKWLGNTYDRVVEYVTV